ncbi:sulfatase family protein [Saccharicrinis aurantiacus]|uniref:sulfatase family protein n=1 Tax=Saccharicrinis aurantiacus TaxID=1849719 RepID=UPI000AD4F4EF|nr:sulfatase-like hydrolase/transferase [Saccharicrinis aurantiacus]
MNKLLNLNLWRGYLAVALFAMAALSCTNHTKPNKETIAKKPNVVIILADDLGWGDVGFNGCTDIPTPNLDALASDGVIFTSGYASHSYCGPSRSGLLTGKYQARFGCGNNLSKDLDGPQGLPTNETFISNVLKEDGYNTCAIGKWHLGDSIQFWPTQRGFDDWYGFTGGARNYWGQSWDKKSLPWHLIRRNGEPVPLEEQGYLTDDFTNEAINYIDDYTKSDKPFFMYLAYNAPHAPIQATKEYLNKTEHIENGKRAAYGGLVVGMDEGIGKVIAKLKEAGEYENTLFFFYSDNGGHGSGTRQEPYRGRKGNLFEGGIRVPFLMTWPAGLKGGKQYHKPIVAYDIFTTILGATQINYSKSADLDGTNLLPYVKGKVNNEPHDKIFWRYSDGLGYAVRKGDYKLVKEEVRQELFLFNMKTDSLEQFNLAAAMPEKLNELKADYTEWNKGNINNLWPDAHPEHVYKEKAIRERAIKAACGGENKKPNQY